MFPDHQQFHCGEGYLSLSVYLHPYRPKTKKIPIQKYLGKPNKNVRDTLVFCWYFFFRKTDVFVQKSTKLKKLLWYYVGKTQVKFLRIKFSTVQGNLVKSKQIPIKLLTETICSLKKTILHTICIESYWYFNGITQVFLKNRIFFKQVRKKHLAPSVAVFLNSTFFSFSFFFVFFLVFAWYYLGILRCFLFSWFVSFTLFLLFSSFFLSSWFLPFLSCFVLLLDLFPSSTLAGTRTWDLK